MIRPEKIKRIHYDNSTRLLYTILCFSVLILLSCGQDNSDKTSSTKEVKDSTVVFRLDVDGSVVDSVQLVGEFTDWEDKPISMLYDTTDRVWKVRVPLSSSQRTYKYKFRVHRSDSNTWIPVSDPKSTLIDASFDRNSVLILQEKDIRFSPFTSPALEDLIIYELNPREFVDSSVPFSDVAGDLNAADYGRVFRSITRSIEEGYFTDLGVNVIELMPVLATAWTGFQRSSHERDPWGYNCFTWFGLNGDFGTPEDLKVMVESAHRKGLAVLLDFSLGHGSGQIIAQIHPDWLEMGHNPWGMIQFDMSVEGARNYMLDAAKLWLEDYNIDGFRMDWIDQYRDEKIQWYPGGTWAWFTEQLRKIKSEIILIAENPTPEIVRNTQFDSCWDFFFAEWCGAILLREAYSYYDGFVGSLVSSQMKMEENLTHYVYAPWGPHKPIVRFLESHDTPRIVKQMVIAQHGGGPHGWLDVNGDEIIPDTLYNGGIAKSKLGAVLLLTLPGPIMLFQGQEFGAEDGLDWIYDPLDWSRREVNDSLFQFYKSLISLRMSQESLRSEDLTVTKNDTTNHVFVYARGVKKDDPYDDNVVVALNFGNNRGGIKDVSVSFIQPGIWIDFFSSDSIKVDSDLEKRFDFAYSEGKIFLYKDQQ